MTSSNHDNLASRSAAMGAAAGTVAMAVTGLSLATMLPFRPGPAVGVGLAVAASLAAVAAYVLTVRREPHVVGFLRATSVLQERLGIFRLLAALIVLTIGLLLLRMLVPTEWTRPGDALFNALLTLICYGSAGRTIRDAEALPQDQPTAGDGSATEPTA